MLNRRPALLLAAVTVAATVATGCGQQSAAVRVDDESVSRSDFEDELEAYFDNDDLRSAVLGDQTPRADLSGDLRGSYSQEFVGTVAEQQVLFLLAANVRDDEGVEVTDADRLGVREQLDQLPGASSLADEIGRAHV